MSATELAETLGWPWVERRGGCVATPGPGGDVTLAWEPDTANCAVVSRELLEGVVADINLTRRLLIEALNAWEGYEQEAHEAGRCIGYGFCQNEPCTEMSPRIAEIRRSVGIQA